MHRQGLAALNGRRLFSTEQPGMADRLKSAQQTASKVLAAPGRAAHSIRESVKSTSLVAYNQLPAPVSWCLTWLACLLTRKATRHTACTCTLPVSCCHARCSPAAGPALGECSVQARVPAEGHWPAD